MSIHLVTFATPDMATSAGHLMRSAHENGVDSVYFWGRSDLEATDFYRENRELLDEPRGSGYWAWKPFVILDLMNRHADGDTIIYSDSGVMFIDNVKYIVDRMDQDVWLFGNQWEHAHWCKKDTIDWVWPLCTHGGRGCQCDWQASLDRFGKQVQASVVFIRNTEYARKFVKEWLEFCTIKRLIDDSPGWAKNHPEFQEHRHDQAILTTLAYKYGIPLHWWPARYNDGAFTYEKGQYTDDYPALVSHHRRRNSEWRAVA